MLGLGDIQTNKGRVRSVDVYFCFMAVACLRYCYLRCLCFSLRLVCYFEFVVFLNCFHSVVPRLVVSNL